MLARNARGVPFVVWILVEVFAKGFFPKRKLGFYKSAESCIDFQRVYASSGTNLLNSSLALSTNPLLNTLVPVFSRESLKHGFNTGPSFLLGYLYFFLFGS